MIVIYHTIKKSSLLLLVIIIIALLFIKVFANKIVKLDWSEIKFWNQSKIGIFHHFTLNLKYPGFDGFDYYGTTFYHLIHWDELEVMRW